jgi:DnaJ-class molecular chaperone
MMTWKAACELLELADDHDLDEVQPAFRRAARRWHPDSSCDSTTTELFVQAQEAYERLTHHRDTPDDEDSDEGQHEPGLRHHRRTRKPRHRHDDNDGVENFIFTWRTVTTTYERGTVTRTVRDGSFNLGPIVAILRAIATQYEVDDDDDDVE